MNASESNERLCCGVVELRQYTLKPGHREAMIDLFDNHLLDPQEASGMTVVGQFRDRRRGDRFVWVRGFPDMARRQASLEQFYGGPVWAAHRDAANRTMVDSDNVLLLKPARPELAFRLDARDGPRAAEDAAAAVVVAGIHGLRQPADASLLSEFERRVMPALDASGVRINGVFVTEPAPNTFRLPVREGEQVLVWFGVVEGHESETEGWRERLGSASTLAGQPPDLLELNPTSRSVLGRGRARARAWEFGALIGSWKIHNRYLVGRLRGSTEWIEFEGRSKVEALLNGLGQIERYAATRDGKRIEGMTLRLRDPKTDEWSLYWADTVRAGILQPPMIGRFRGGVGEFLGDEEVDGRKVLCRFRWTGMGSDSPRWEQAFSNDEGRTWETNWIMRLTRAEE